MNGNNIVLGILASALIIFTLVAIIVFVIIAARRQRLKQDLTEARYKTKINDITFAALRSQMNPHFIFNCLNSIKYLTEQNKSEVASKYLDKFALLIRNILNNARCEKITLTDEIASVRLYLELEAMRFKEKLQYNITICESVDAEFIEVPPMIIQPYVENAIWHGLMPKEKGGRVTIDISQQHDSCLIIFIEDNGIGRFKSAEIRNNSNYTHKSFGTQITDERINLLNEIYSSNKASVNITDLYDDFSHPTGTKVIIKLPIK